MENLAFAVGFPRLPVKIVIFCGQEVYQTIWATILVPPRARMAMVWGACHGTATAGCHQCGTAQLQLRVLAQHHVIRFGTVRPDWLGGLA